MLATSSIAVHTTPLGTVWSHWTDLGLYQLTWQAPSVEQMECESSTLNAEVCGEIDSFDRRLDSYFRHGRELFDDVKVDPTGWTPFQSLVYQQCRSIRPGVTLTYKQLAKLAGSEKASRAVGAAMARNRVPLIIPCHRVVSTGGDLRGFSAPGGLATKRFLLDLESSSES